MNLDLTKITFIEIIDAILAAGVLLTIYKLLKGQIARNIFNGYVFIFIMYLVAKVLGLNLLTTLLGEFLRWGVLGIIIIFQQEIRRFLQIIGKSAVVQNNSILKKIYKPNNHTESHSTLQIVVDATKAMAITHMGALIVINKENDLGRFIESGDVIDSIVSKRLIISIFNKKSPLHDGAMIIQNDRIRSVKCSLPISESGTISPNIGFRHRAAIGMSERTDAAIIVVSEESGEIALAVSGEIIRKLTINQLNEKLMSYFG